MLKGVRNIKERNIRKTLDDIDEGNGKDDKSSYYTGSKSKDLLIHVIQNDVEVDKPVKMKIYNQKAEWQKRQWPIVPDRFIYDYNGTAHQYVDVNDVAVLTIHKDHTDQCRTCSKKMTIDARSARELGKRGVFHAIWGIDSTHMILILVMAIGAIAMAGFAFYSYNQDTLHKTQLEGANTKVNELRAEVTRLNEIINPTPVEPLPDASGASGRPIPPPRPT